MCAVKNMIAINLFQCFAARFFFIHFMLLLCANFKPAFPYNNQMFWNYSFVLLNGSPNLIWGNIVATFCVFFLSYLSPILWYKAWTAKIMIKLTSWFVLFFRPVSFCRGCLCVPWTVSSPGGRGQVWTCPILSMQQGYGVRHRWSCRQGWAPSTRLILATGGITRATSQHAYVCFGARVSGFAKYCIPVWWNNWETYQCQVLRLFIYDCVFANYRHFIFPA